MFYDLYFYFKKIIIFSNIKSSEDISSGYSSGEALHTQRGLSQPENQLTRTSSVGARNRIKQPRLITKKTPEVILKHLYYYYKVYTNWRTLFPIKVQVKESSTILKIRKLCSLLNFEGRRRLLANTSARWRFGFEPSGY